LFEPVGDGTNGGEGLGGGFVAGGFVFAAQLAIRPGKRVMRGRGIGRTALERGGEIGNGVLGPAEGEEKLAAGVAVFGLAGRAFEGAIDELESPAQSRRIGVKGQEGGGVVQESGPVWRQLDRVEEVAPGGGQIAAFQGLGAQGRTPRGGPARLVESPFELPAGGFSGTPGDSAEPDAFPAQARMAQARRKAPLEDGQRSAGAGVAAAQRVNASPARPR